MLIAALRPSANRELISISSRSVVKKSVHAKMLNIETHESTFVREPRIFGPFMLDETK